MAPYSNSTVTKDDSWNAMQAVTSQAPSTGVVLASSEASSQSEDSGLTPLELNFLIVGVLFAVVVVLAVVNILLQIFHTTEEQQQQQQLGNGHRFPRGRLFTGNLYSVSSYLDRQGPFSNGCILTSTRGGATSTRHHGFTVKLSMKARASSFI